MSEARGTLSPPDAVLARLAPNTPPRGKRKGKGKGPQATERGASSATPTAPNDVDGEGRPVSGEHNIASDLEEAQLQEAIRMSLVDQGGSGVDSSSAGFTHGSSYDLGTNSECSDSDNVFELSDSDEGWTPSREKSKRRVKHSHKKRGTATAAAPSKRQRVHGGSSSSPRVATGVGGDSRRGSGGRAGGGAGRSCEYLKTNTAHRGLRASDLMDKLVGMSAAMEALGKALEKVLKQLHRREKPIGETFKAALGILDAAAVKLGIGGAGEITDGVSIGQDGTAWPAADSNTVFVWAMCDKEESSISRPGTSSDNHTVRATRALVELCCPGEKAGTAWFGFNFNPFLCVRQDDACDVEHVGVGGAFVRLVMLATLAAGGVTVNRCLSLTSKGSKDGGGGFALEGLRNHLPPCVVHTLEGGFELAARARNANSRVSHPTTYQPVGARSPALVAAVVSDALVEVLRLPRQCRPSAELNEALQKFLAGLGVSGARKMRATATALPTPAPREVAINARLSAIAAIAKRLGGGADRVEELFGLPTMAEAKRATEAGNHFVAEVASKVWGCAGGGVTASGIVVGEGWGAATTTLLSFNSKAQGTGDLAANSSSWAAALAISAAATAGRNAEDFADASAVLATARQAQTVATCTDLYGLNDRLGDMSVNSRAPSPDGRVQQKLPTSVREALRLTTSTPTLVDASVALAVGLHETVRQAGGGGLVLRFGVRGPDVVTAFREHWPGQNRVVDISDIVRELAEKCLGGGWGIGRPGMRPRVRVIVRPNGLRNTVLVDNLFHPSAVQAASIGGLISGAVPGAVTEHYAAPAIAVVTVLALVRDENLFRGSLPEFTFGHLVGGSGGWLSALCALSGTIGGAAKYTAEERGAEKSTVELKAEGATASLKPTTAARPAYQRMVAAGKTPTRQGVNFTGPEKKRTKSTNELKGEGGKEGGKAGGEDGKHTGTEGGTGSGSFGAGKKNAEFTLQHATRVREGLDPGFTYVRCSQGAGKECGRCTFIDEWDGLAMPDLRPGAAQDAWVAVMGEHKIQAPVGPGGRWTTTHKGALVPWKGDADTGTSLKRAKGVKYLSAYQAGEIVKKHVELYKEWAKTCPDNKPRRRRTG